MRKIIFALTTGLLCSTAALAQPPLERVGQAWHNGSLMNVFTRADLVRIEYLQPRPSLAAIGVIPGTVLLTGQWIDRELVATAVVFPPGCPATPYAVRGTVDANEILTVVGPAPSLVGEWCQVLELDWTANSYLRFDPARPPTDALAREESR
jgi:hypothetical protein